MKKYNLLVPMAGLGKRFSDQGYTMPKPLTMVDHRQSIDWSMGSIVMDECNLIFVVRRDHVNNFSIDEVLRQKFGKDIQVVVAEKDTRGSVETCLLATEFLEQNELPLIVYCMDVVFSPRFDPATVPAEADGFLLTFKANNPAYSYVKLDDKGKVLAIAEKSVISQDGVVGVYCFKSSREFVHQAQHMIEGKLHMVNNEFYVSPMYNLYLDKHRTVLTRPVEEMHVIGTPEELTFFQSVVLPEFGAKPVALCADHSGHEAKERMKALLRARAIQFVDFGTYTAKDCDYNEYVRLAANALNRGQCDFALGFCRSGQGVNMAANKCMGVRAALTYDLWAAKAARAHNAANFFSIPSRNLTDALLEDILEALLKTRFEGGRHSERIRKTMSYENKSYNGV